MSIKSNFAVKWMAQEIVEIKVTAEHHTRSFLFKFKTLHAMIKPFDALDNAIAYLLLHFLDKANSNFETKGPCVIKSFFNVFETDTEVVSRKTLLAKYDISGNIEWTKILGSSLTYFAWDIAVDSMDNIYLTKFSENSFAQNSGWKEDIHIMKFNKDGIKL